MAGDRKELHPLWSVGERVTVLRGRFAGLGGTVVDVPPRGTGGADVEIDGLGLVCWFGSYDLGNYRGWYSVRGRGLGAADPISVVRELLRPVTGPIWQETTAGGEVLLRLPTPLLSFGHDGPCWTWVHWLPQAILAGHLTHPKP